MDRILSFCERSLFFLVIFLIPTNWFLKGPTTSVYGINIDYLMPKLYASDLIMLALFALVGWRLRKKIWHWIKNLQLNNFTFLILLLLFSLLVSATQSPYPIAGYWYLGKLGQMILLVVYMIHRVKLAWLASPLIFAGLFQSLVGLIQWFQRSSILGYMFLGETELGYTSLIAKSNLTREVRPLPYGTTAHPNILAGFLLISILVLLYYWIKTKPQTANPWFYWTGRLILILPLLTTLILTQAISAILLLILGILLLLIQNLTKRLVLIISCVVLALGLVLVDFVPETSFSRRSQLAQISQQMILSEPLLGVGPNNFTARMSDFGQVIGNHRFIQPVHNIYLLWLSEAGLVNTTLLALIMHQLWQRHPLKLKDHRAVVPLLVVGLIGLVDHYPLSLQTGMLVSCIAIWLALEGSKKAS